MKSKKFCYLLSAELELHSNEPVMASEFQDVLSQAFTAYAEKRGTAIRLVVLKASPVGLKKRN